MANMNRTKVITGINTKLSYFHGWEPVSINGGAEKYSVSVLIPMAEVHHKDRVADKPERAFDPTNLAVIRKDEHSEYHNSDYPQNEKGYEQFEKKYKK